MNIQITSEQKIIQEGEWILRKHLGPAKAARFLSAWRQGAGDYLKIKKQLFNTETVDSLYKKVKKFEKTEK